MAEDLSLLDLWVMAIEPSAENLALPMIQALRKRQPSIKIGVLGGPRLTATGLPIVMPATGLVAHGLWDILMHGRKLWRARGQFLRLMHAQPPRMIVVVDSVSVGIRAFKRAPPSVLRVQYVAPMVWVWGRKRVQFCQHYDLLLTLFPFEQPYFAAAANQASTAASCDVRCVGHTLLHPLPPPAPPRPPLHDGQMVDVALYPGSRPGELRRHLPLMGQVWARLLRKATEGASPLATPDRHPLRAVVVVLPEAEAFTRAQIRRWFPPNAHVMVVATSAQHDAIKTTARAAIAASGTITLELAIAGVPHVMVGKVDWLMRALSWVVRPDLRWLHLVNRGAEHRIVPEYMFGAINPDAIATDTLALLGEAGDAQRAALREALQRLQVPGVERSSDYAATVLLARLGLADPPDGKGDANQAQTL